MMSHGFGKKPGILYWVSGLLLCTMMVGSALGQQIRTVAGDGTFGFAGDGGLATISNVADPVGVFVDSLGNIYIADTSNRRIRKIDTSGVITTVAGNGNFGFAGDGGQATDASLADPSDVFVDPQGNIFVADTNNQRIRKIDTSGVITTIAGNGNAGYSGDGGDATLARLNFPTGLFVDTQGNLFFADRDNHRIRKVDGAGVITTVAGNGGFGSSGDGGLATSANLAFPSGVFVDPAGAIYIADRFNYKIRKVDTLGVITTVAGNGAFGFSGDGGLAVDANLAFPSDVYVGSDGAIFIADRDNHRIRKVDISGVITTVAGDGTGAFGGDGADALSARLNRPSGIWGDDLGTVWVADTNNRRIRKIVAPIRVSSPVVGLSGIQSAQPNDEVVVYQVGIVGDGVSSLSNVQLTLTDLSTPTGLLADDISALRLYASIDSLLDVGDAMLTELTSVPVGSQATLVPDLMHIPSAETQLYYFATAVLSNQAVDRHAFRIALNTGSLVTSINAFGQAIGANDANRVVVDIVATQLVFAPSPSGSVSGQALSVQPVVRALDASGHLDLDFSEAVTLTLLQGAGQLNNVVVSAINGVATFTTVTYVASADGESVVLQANDEDGSGGDLTPATASAFNSNVIATQMVFATPPAGSVSGQPLSTQPVVVAQDASGLIDTDFSDTVTLLESSAGSLSNANVQAVNGVATFIDVIYMSSVDAESFTLVADDLETGSEGDLTPVSAAPLVGEVVATRLVFSVLPSGSVSGSPLGVQPVISALDGAGLVDTDFSENVNLTLSQGSGLLSHNTVQAVNGVAAFVEVTYTASTDQEIFTLTANDNDGLGSDLPLVSANGLTSDIVATQLVFDVLPSGVVSGQLFVTQPIVVARDSLGGIDTDFSDTISLSESSAGALSNGSVQAVNGVATFTNATYTSSVDREGFIIVADDMESGSEGDLAPVSAAPLVGEVVATRLVFSVLPSGSVSGLPLGVQPVVSALDGDGLVDADFSESVRLSLSQGAGALNNHTVQASNGVAAFSQLTYTASSDQETFALTANDNDALGSDLPLVSANGLTSDIVATQLVFDVLPAGVVSGQPFVTQPIVVARDSLGGIDTDFSDLLTLSEDGAGLLINATVQAVNGVGSFSNVIYTSAIDGGSFTLSVDDELGGGEGDLAAVEVGPLVSDIAATRLVFSIQPSGSLSGIPLNAQPMIIALDDSGRVDANFNELISLNLLQGTGRLYNNTRQAVNGVAAFSNLIYVAGADGESFVIEANDDDLVGTDLPSISSVAVSSDILSTHLSFKTQPSNPVSGQPFETQPVVVALNDSGQVDAGFSDVITLTSDGLGTLTSSSTLAANGVATFQNVVYSTDIDGETITLRANDEPGGNEGDLNTIASGSLVSDILATRLVFTVQPSESISGHPFETQPVVAALDQDGRVDVHFSEIVVLNLIQGDGRLVNNQVQAQNGVATFSHLVYWAGADREPLMIGANDQDDVGSNLPVAQANETVSDILATHLVFRTLPEGVVSGTAFAVQPVVDAVNDSGQVDTDFADVVILRVGTGAGSLHNSAVNAVNGVATFEHVLYLASVDGESFTITADDALGGVEGNLDAIQSGAFVSDIIATHLAFTHAPAGAVSGLALTEQPTVSAVNDSGQIDRDFNDLITLSSDVGVLANNTQEATAGIAVFEDVIFNATSDKQAFVMRADDDAQGPEGDLDPVAASSLVSEVVATQLRYLVQPAGSVSGRLFSTQPVVVAMNEQGLIDIDFQDTVTLAVEGAGRVSQASVAAVSGIATFSQLVYETDGQVQPFRLIASGGILDTALSQSVSSLVVATQLVFAVQPAGSVSGVPLLVQPVVEARDSLGQIDRSFSETLTLRSTGLGEVKGQTVVAQNGRAVFSELTYVAASDQEAIRFVVDDGVENGGGLPAKESDVLISDVVATQLTYVVQPSDVVSGKPFSVQPQVAAVDSLGAVDTGFSERVSLLSSNAGVLVQNEAQMSGGFATFEGLTYRAVEDGETLVLTVDDQAGGLDLLAVDSDAVGVDVVATRLTFTIQPNGSVSGKPFLTQPEIAAVDSAGLVDKDFAELIRFTTQASGVLTHLVVSLNDGVGQSAGLTFLSDKDGQKIALLADDAVGGLNLNSVLSDTFICDVVASTLSFEAVPPRVANGVVFSTQPVVKAHHGGVIDVDFEDWVSLTSDGRGHLRAESVVAVAGVAVFDEVVYVASRDHEPVRLIANDSVEGGEGDLPQGLSSTIFTDVTATHLLFQVMPSGILSGRPFLTQPVVIAVDSLGVIDTDFDASIVLVTEAGGQLLNTQGAAVDGVVQFDNVSYVASSGLETFVIQAQVQSQTATLVPAFSELLTAGAGSPHHLGIFLEGADLIANGATTQDVIIRVLDENGNPNLEDSSTRITMLVQGAATGGGDVVVNEGEATFKVRATTQTGLVTLLASADGLVGAVDTFDTVAGKAHSIAIVFDKQPLLANGVSSRDVHVELRDVNGNLRTQDNSSVVALGVSGVATGGGGTQTVNGGIAVFNVKAGTDPGVIQLRANAGGLPEVTTGILVGAVKPNLIITQPPVGPERIFKGESHTIALQIKNVGLDTVRNAFDISVKLVGGADSIDVGKAIVPTAVAPDSVLDIAVDFSVPSFSFARLASDYHWVATVDAGGFVSEDDETDNLSRGNRVLFPDLLVSESLLDFQTVIPDSMFANLLLLENRGTAELLVRVVSSDSQLTVSDFADSQSVLLPGESRLLKVLLHPKRTMAFKSQLTFMTNDPKGDVIVDVIARVAAPDRVFLDLNSAQGNQNLMSIETGRDERINLELFLNNMPPIQALSVDINYNPELLVYEEKSWQLGGYFVGGVLINEVEILGIGKIRLSGGSVGNEAVSSERAFGRLNFSTPQTLPLEDEELATQISAVQMKFVENDGQRDSLQLHSIAEIVLKTQSVWPDLDGDGKVMFADFLIFVAAFRKDETSPGWGVELPEKPFPLTPYRRFDVDGDGQIGFFDFVTYAQDFTKAQE